MLLDAILRDFVSELHKFTFPIRDLTAYRAFMKAAIYLAG